MCTSYRAAGKATTVRRKLSKNLEFLKRTDADFNAIQKAFTDSRVTLKNFENVKFGILLLLVFLIQKKQVFVNSEETGIRIRKLL